MKRLLRTAITMLIVVSFVFAGYPALKEDSASYAASYKIKSLTAKATGETTASLSWTKNKSAKGYTVFRNGKVVARLGKNTTNYKDKGLKAGTAYSYVVKMHTSKK